MCIVWVDRSVCLFVIHFTIFSLLLVRSDFLVIFYACSILSSFLLFRVDCLQLSTISVNFACTHHFGHRLRDKQKPAAHKVVASAFDAPDDNDIDTSHGIRQPNNEQNKKKPLLLNMHRLAETHPRLMAQRAQQLLRNAREPWRERNMAEFTLKSRAQRSKSAWPCVCVRAHGAMRE